MNATLTVDQAAERLARGELVAFATETVYGLGADACNPSAVAQIFATKGRPADHPLIVHIDSVEAIDAFADMAQVRQATPWVEPLLRAFWPGPLTIILPRRAGVATQSAGGHPTIGLRCPAHESALQLLRAARALGVLGVAAPSANRFGRVSPTTAQHVRQEFGESVAVLDGGACQVGIESTIVDATRGAPIVLRPGMIGLEPIAQACGQRAYSQEQWLALHGQARDLADPALADAPRASGSLEQHYAPTAKIRLMTAQELQSALDVLAQTEPAAGPPRIALYARSNLRVRTRAVRERRMPDDPAATAQQLYAALRSFDDEGVALIWIEAVPEEAAWAAVRDRLQRAAA